MGVATVGTTIDHDMRGAGPRLTTLLMTQPPSQRKLDEEHLRESNPLSVSYDLQKTTGPIERYGMVKWMTLRTW